MAKPTKHGDKWRIRWLDEHGQRQSAVSTNASMAQSIASRQGSRGHRRHALAHAERRSEV